MKQTPVCILCDLLISNSTLKDDVERWMSKDSRYVRNTERGLINKLVYAQWKNETW